MTDQQPKLLMQVAATRQWAQTPRSHQGCYSWGVAARLRSVGRQPYLRDNVRLDERSHPVTEHR
jgi:hypothetical protein